MPWTEPAWRRLRLGVDGRAGASSPHPEVHSPGTRQLHSLPHLPVTSLSFPSHADLCAAGNAWKGVGVIMVGSAFFKAGRYTS